MQVKQRTSNVFSANTKSKSNPDPAAANKTSIPILLEAAGVWVQKIQNPVHAHLWTLCASVTLIVTSFQGKNRFWRWLRNQLRPLKCSGATTSVFFQLDLA